MLWATAIPAQTAIAALDEAPHISLIQLVRMTCACIPFVPAMLSLTAFSRRKEWTDALLLNTQETELLSGPSKEERRTPGDVSGRSIEVVKDLVHRPDERLAWAGAMELAFWQVLGTSLQFYALKEVPVARAGLLLATLNGLVPAGAAIQGEKVSIKQWVGCALALTGAALIEIFRGEEALTTSDGLSGDALLLVVAAIYATYTVRLGHHSRKVDPTLLSTCKVISAMTLCGLWFGGVFASCSLASPDGKSARDLFAGVGNVELWGLLAWLGKVSVPVACLCRPVAIRLY